ncbi:MAG: hypothetical protein COV35_02100 [Alphaproteobacteria bacterium CG11_big_fil_rev_8_21_14_0_20_39_49]|nr:MAG: hypothetical protein COV35_02100 [Alphaproteobacteria bacterium CG11_big_fil_rev_8_21_14_0_20_39_49]
MGKLLDELKKQAKEAKKENNEIKKELEKIKQYRDDLNKEIEEKLSLNLQSVSDKIEAKKEELQKDLKDLENKTKH